MNARHIWHRAVCNHRDLRCEGTNIWVYQAPSFEPGVCEELMDCQQAQWPVQI
jgi:hypothetical protein